MIINGKSSAGTQTCGYSVNIFSVSCREYTVEWKEAKNMVCALGQIDALVRYLPGLRDIFAWYQVQGVNHRAIENHRRRIRLYSGKKDCG